MSNLVDILFNAADAPALRSRVAELEATVTALTTERDALRVENDKLRGDYEFYLCAFCQQAKAKSAELAWEIG